MSLHLEDDQMCYVCGSKNTKGLRLKFTHPEKGRLLSKVVFSKEHQGFKDIVHGGMLATVLDEIMVNLAWTEGILVVTAELNVKLKKPTKVGEEVILEGKLDKETSKVLYFSSVAKDKKGQILAQATAVCVRIKSA